MTSGKPVALVTGGAGFIGSHMVDHLLVRGYRVRVIDDLSGGRKQNLSQHSDDPCLDVEIRDIRTVKHDDPMFSDVKLVFHFAGIGDIVPSIMHPAEYMSTNVQGTVAMLEGARHAKVERFVYAASSSCYGIAQVPTREDHPIAPQYPYALSKYLGELSVFHWAEVYGLPVNSIRIFNAYGTRSRTSGAYGAVFGVFLKQKLAGSPLTIVSDGEQKRDFVYVTDIVDAFHRAALTDNINQIYNLGAGNPQSINRLADLMGGERVDIPKRPGEPDCTWSDITKITAELGWRQLVSFEEGVSRVLDDIAYWRDAPLWTPESIAEANQAWFTALSKSN